MQHHHPEKKESEIILKLEKPYMEALIHSLRPHGDVLQIGFGSGHAANYIQAHRPKSHTIIEYDMTIVQKARAWATGFSNITVIQDEWKTALPMLGVFDAISYNEIPLMTKNELNQSGQEVNQAKMILKKGNDLLHMVQETFPEITHIKYSNHDLNEFCKNTDKASHQELSRFIFELKRNGQITEMQYEEVLQKFNLIRNECAAPALEVKKRSTLLYDLVTLCLEKNMRKRSRFASLLSASASNYEDPLFFDKIITNPFVEYEEQSISSNIPEMNELTPALVMIIEKF